MSNCDDCDVDIDKYKNLSKRLFSYFNKISQV